MDQKIKTFVEFEIEKHKLHRNKNLFLLEDVDTYNKLASNKISSGKKTVNTLLLTCMMIIKLSHYLQCF